MEFEYCKKCNKPLINIGITPNKDICQCHRVLPENYTFGGMAGLICPRCGRGNSPFTQTCSCVPPPPFNITC